MSTSDEKRERPKWTVMVFMGAETIEGNEPLDDAAEADLARNTVHHDCQSGSA